MSQLFSLKWTNHMSNMLDGFNNLLLTEAMVDVTLACDGLSLKAHKIVLSACSPFFQSLFLENPCKHPIVILKDVKYTELKAVIEFMYHGEVNVAQEQLHAVMKTAEALKVKGFLNVSKDKRQSVDEASHLSSSETSMPTSKRKKRRTRKRSINDQSSDRVSQSKASRHQDSDIEDGSSDMDHNINSPCSSMTTVPSQTHHINSFHKSQQELRSIEQHTGDSFVGEKFNAESAVELVHNVDENLAVFIDQLNASSTYEANLHQDNLGALKPSDSQPQRAKRSGDDLGPIKPKRRGISCPFCPYSNNLAKVKVHILLKHSESDYLKNSKSDNQKYFESDCQKENKEPAIIKPVEPATLDTELAVQNHFDPFIPKCIAPASMKYNAPLTMKYFEPAIPKSIKPVIKKEIESDTEKYIEPVTHEQNGSSTQNAIQAAAKKHIESGLVYFEPVMQKHVKPVIQKQIEEAATEEHVEPVTKKLTEPGLVTKYFAPPIQKPVKPVIQKQVEAAAEEHVEPLAQEPTESVTQEHMEPVIQIQEHNEHVTQGHTEPVTQECVEPVTEKQIEAASSEFATHEHRESDNVQPSASDNQSLIESNGQVCDEMVMEKLIELDDQEDEDSETRYPCPFCLYSNRKSENLKLHIRRQHKEHRLLFLDL